MSRRGSTSLPPKWWEQLQGTLKLISDPRARREGIPLAEVSRLTGLPADKIGNWVDQLSLAGPEDADPSSLLDAYLTGRRFFIGSGPSLPGPTRLTLLEILALLTLIGQLEVPESAGQLNEQAQRLREKLLNAVSAGVEETACPIAERVKVQTVGTESAAHLDTLHEAREKCLCVNIEYYNLERDLLWKRKVRPCLLLQHLGIWYTVVDEAYILRVDRLRNVELTSDSFELPEDFDPEVFRKKVMFVGKAEHEIRLRSRSGEWTVPTASPRTVRSWAVSSKGSLVIDGPRTERDKLVEEVKEILAKYAAP